MRGALRDRARQCETDRRISDDTIEELAQSGLFRVTMPRRCGGHGADLMTHVRVSAELGKACPSTAWVQSILASVNTAACTQLGDRAVEEIFGANPDARVCGVNTPGGTARRADGGYRVTATWPFASGCGHAQWALCAATETDETGSVVGPLAVVMPLDDLAVKDVWHVAGMSGTGSNTLVADEVFVPEHRAVGVSTPLPAHDREAEPVDHWPFVPLFAIGLVGPLLGAAEGMLEHVIAASGSRRVSYFTYRKQTDSHVLLEQIGEAALLIDSAWLHVQRAAKTIDEPWADPQRDGMWQSRGQADAAFAVGRLREAADILMSISGASAFAASSDLQRLWRDLNTGSRHGFLNTAMSQELYGRALCGAASNSVYYPVRS
jgi:alkylation response protein AidB-like acyl-CoA dehydrogenase